MKSIFKFKEFSIDQTQTAMKVGTDSVLLGAWTSIKKQPKSILDIGAGTGILSLMLAQRSNAGLIDAIEIDPLAYEQCVQNFENSQWADRLFCYHSSFSEFVREIDDRYDLIICNPPFFNSNSLNTSRQQARNNGSLPFNELIKGASHFLSSKGHFSLIIPIESEKKVIALCENNKLYPNRITRVRGNANAKLKRSLIEVSRVQQTIDISEMTIEIERHLYTTEYIDLTKDFYLNM